MNSTTTELFAYGTIISAIVAVLSLAILHFVSKEFKPSWRMISEYALGKHKWLITTFFIFWGLSTFFVCCLLWGITASVWLKFGIILLLISGVGEIMGGLFDVQHKLHGMSFLLGVPTLPAAALIISYQLRNLDAWNTYQSALINAAHATWISLIIMGVAMMVMFAGFKKAGIAVGPDEAAPATVPKGVIAVGGYANRLLVLCYIHWLVVIATTALVV